MNSVFLWIALYFIVIVPSYAVSRTINRIDIVGNKTIGKEAVQAQLKTKKGSRLRDSRVIQDVQRLYDMGYFDRISARSKIEKNQLIVTFEVQEKPRVSSIKYKGNSALTDKKLEELSELKKYEFLSVKKLQQAISNIKKGYQEKGYFLPVISYQIKNQKKEGKIDLIINIQEGGKALIRRIRFIGNKNVSDRTIKAFMSSKEKNILSFITGAGIYKKENISRDQQVIRFLYMERGYMEVKVGEPQITLSPSADGIYISFYISEGERFEVGQIDFSGDLIFSKLELRKLLSLKAGDFVRYSFIQNDLQALQTRYGDEGYAFANVVPRFAPQDKDTIHILFDIQKGEKVYINHINISGNSLTRDRVIRREMNFFEGELYNASSISEAKKSLQRFGYIESVDILSDPVDSQTVNVEVSVKERELLGQIQGGPGYSTATGVTLNGEFSRENIFGLGVTAALQANIITTLWATRASVKEGRQSAYVYTPSTFLSFQYINPRLMDSDWYFGGSFFIEDTQITQCLVDSDFRKDPKDNSVTRSRWDCIKDSGDSVIEGSFNARNYLRPYFSEKIRTHLTFGRWLKSDSKVIGKWGIERQLLSAQEPEIIEKFQLKENSGWRHILGGSFEYDNRDDQLFPTNGLLTHTSLDHIYKWSDSNHLIRFDWTGSHYISTQKLLSVLPLDQSAFYSPFMEFLGRLVWKNKLQYGRVYSLSQKSIPVDMLYLLGGPHSLRGYQQYSVGTRKEISGNSLPYGGRQKLLYNLELQFPVVPKVRLYGLLFFDMGFAEDRLFAGWKTFLDQLKKDVGLGVMLVTPMGPVNLKWGIPLSSEYKLNIEKAEFHFSVGADF